MQHQIHMHNVKSIPKESIFLTTLHVHASIFWINADKIKIVQIQVANDVHITTSSKGNIFCDTGPLCGEFTGHWWIPRTMFSLIYAWTNGCVNTREVSDLRAIAPIATLLLGVYFIISESVLDISLPPGVIHCRFFTLVKLDHDYYVRHNQTWYLKGNFCYLACHCRSHAGLSTPSPCINHCKSL